MDYNQLKEKIANGDYDVITSFPGEDISKEISLAPLKIKKFQKDLRSMIEYFLWNDDECILAEAFLKSLISHDIVEKIFQETYNKSNSYENIADDAYKYTKYTKKILKLVKQ